MKKFRIVALLLVMCLASSCFVGGTFAKYTSTATGSDVASIAQWKVIWETTEISVTGAAPSLTLDLFSTIKDSNATADETNVKADMIAPGTTGAFNFDIKNASEVDAEYTITVALDNVPANIEFAVGNGAWIKGGAGQKLVLTGTLDKEQSSGTTSDTINWRWTFKDGVNTNESDTALGIAAQSANDEILVSASILVEQVD